MPLCPFCDEPWPIEPTPHLKNLLAGALARGRPSPTPKNPDHRDVSLILSSEVCGQHKLEIDAALGPKDWPDVNFDEIPKRLEGTIDTLLELANDPMESRLYMSLLEKCQVRLRRPMGPDAVSELNVSNPCG